MAMERVGDLPDFRAFGARWAALAAEREAEAARAHQARMATLPPGTCELCYGTQTVEHRYGSGLPRAACPVCDPPILHAEGVPYEFQSARFANYDTAAGNAVALGKARGFLASRRDWYLVAGVGAGKTRLACTIANEAYLQRTAARFVRVPMVLHQLQPGRLAEDVARLEQALFTVPLLVLDDLGAERDMATDYTRRTLLMIYEERGDRGLRTIWTSNKTLQQLAAMQDDDRIASRIAGRADVVKLTMPDQRLLRRAK